ncbi:type IV toxin-antitoxin system AbiEi family antitoxin domain-containing protein [Monashia sp. NPDC004114]
MAGQAGLVTKAQAVAAGIGPEAIRWAVSSRRWVVPHPGVYLTAPGRDDWEVRAVAALLYIGGDVALAGTSAALAWGLERREPEDVEVIVPAGRRASIRPGIAVTRSRVFGRRVHPTAWPHRTTVEHTVLDLGLRRPLDRVLSLAARACQLRLTDEDRRSLRFLSDRIRHTGLSCSSASQTSDRAPRARPRSGTFAMSNEPMACRSPEGRSPWAALDGVTTSTRPSTSCSRSMDGCATRGGRAGFVTASETGPLPSGGASRCVATGLTLRSRRARSRSRSRRS